MKTFLGFVTGLLTGAIAYATLEQYCMRVDEDYAKRVMRFAGYDHVFLIKSKKENETK